jgi:translocation and assembly module TamA
MTRAVAAAGLLALALLLPGCAWLPAVGGAAREAPPGQMAGALPSTGPAPAGLSPPGAPTVRVDIEAPPELKALLERHLDLSRLAQLSRAEAVSDSELSRLIDAAPAQVRELAATEGYFDPGVSIVRTPGAGAGEPEGVLVRLEPGPPTRIGRVTLEVDGPLAQAAAQGDPAAQQLLAAWRQAWRLRSGLVFRNSDWSDAKGAALGFLRAAGYAGATWSGTALEVDPATRLARVFVVADSGPLFRRGPVVIEGLSRHDRRTVLNLLAIPEGQPVTETRLLDAQDRLQKSGLFERVAVVLDGDPAQADQARIVLTLAEASLHQLTTGVGVSANTGPRLTAQHIYRRVFGYPATSRNEFELARAAQTWRGELGTHPNEELYRWVLGVKIDRLKGSDDVVLSQNLRLGRAQDSPRIDRSTFAQLDRSSRRTGSASTESMALSLNSHWTWRNVDNPILPTDGSTLRVELGGGSARASNDTSGGFARAYARATLYRPLPADWFAQARLEIGQVFTPTQLEVPEALRFRAGGDDSVRGYAFRSLGPVTAGTIGSGNSLLTASVEVARPFFATMPTVWAAAFLDAGQAADTFAGLRPAVGAGVGVRWRSPVGPLKLDIARGLEVQQWRLHFSVGIVF